MKRILAALLLALSVGSAQAATTVILVTPGTGTTSPITMVVSGTTLYPVQGMCDVTGNCPIMTGGTVPVSAFIPGGISINGTVAASVTVPAGVSVNGTVNTSTIINGTVQTSTFVSNSTPLGPAAPASATPVTPSNQPVGTGSFATAQVTVGPVATAISVLSARTGVAGTGRAAATVINTTTNDVWLGTTSGVTSLTGVLLPGIKGASVTLNTTAAIFGTSTTSSLLTAVETF